MSTHAIIAVRGGPKAKSRLSGRLDRWQRAELVEAMLLDMVERLHIVRGIERIWVVTPTPTIANVARLAGASTICDIGCGGLNGAFGQARDRICAEFPIAATMLLPGDLPLLNEEEVDVLLRAVSPEAVALAPAASDGGTGALALPARCSIPLAFGADSFDRHMRAAERAGFATHKVEAPNLGFDIDDPADLDALLKRGVAGRTGMLLSNWRAAA